MVVDFRNKLFLEDCYEGLKKLPDGCVDLVVTSPPYWMLRDYKLKKTKWPACTVSIMHGFPPLEVPAMECQLGHEKDPLHFIAHLVLIFNEVRRVLADHGTCWVNMGDSYYGLSGGKSVSNKISEGTNNARTRVQRRSEGMKVKDMVGIPWMLAFALRTSGWYLRSDIIWSKDNAMPESVKDRPSKSHEYIFLLSKSKTYYYDADAIRESHKQSSVERALRAKSGKHKYADFVPGVGNQQGINKPRANLSDRRGPDEALAAGQGLHIIGANKRTVWSCPTIGIKEAHFATFPERLITDCVKAGISLHGNCGSCGKPYTRVTKKTIVPTAKAGKNFPVDQRDKDADSNDQGSNRQKDGHKAGYITDVVTLGWQKSCKCTSTEIVRPTVLDMFVGSGTTPLVSQSYGADYVGFDLNPDNIAISKKRLLKNFGMFA